MSVPLWCRTCGDTVGTRSALSQRVFPDGEDIPCLGKGKHPRPARSEKEICIGLVRAVRLDYTETHTVSSWYKYVGPRNKFMLRIAIAMLRAKTKQKGVVSIFVDGEWVSSERGKLLHGADRTVFAS